MIDYDKTLLWLWRFRDNSKMVISKIKERKLQNPQPKTPDPQTTKTIFEVSVYRLY